MNAQPSREPVRFLVFAASLRSGSLNARLAQLAGVTIEANGGEVDFATMRDFDAPSYDNDVQDSKGFPAGAERGSASASRIATDSWSRRRSTTAPCLGY